MPRGHRKDPHCEVAEGINYQAGIAKKLAEGANQTIQLSLASVLTKERAALRCPSGRITLPGVN